MEVRGSEYQSFLNCRKQWYYQWVEGIEPKKPDGKLFFGTLFHKWLETYYNNNCNTMLADLETSVWLNEQDMKDMEQTEIDEMLKLFHGVAVHYHNTYGESDRNWKVLGTEIEFLVLLQDDLYYTGTIDLIYEVDGKVRFADHKTVASLTMYEEKSRMDRQISRYWWVLKKLSEGVAKVRDRTPGVDRWITYHELEGKEIDGFDYNLIAKDFPREPKVLKLKKNQTVPELSKDKAQKTTYDKYMAKLVELKLGVDGYEEMLDMLKNKPDPFLKRVNVLRTDAELEAAMFEFMYTANDMHDVRLLIENIHNVDALTYRNIGTHCEHMCSYKSLCQTAIEGGNVSLVKNLGYKKREEVK